MSKRLTAEQVKLRLRRLAETDELGLRNANAAYEHAGDLVRDNLIESDEQRRERFEAWCTNCGFSTQHYDDGSFIANDTRAAWFAWQAASTWHGDEPKGGE